MGNEQFEAAGQALAFRRCVAVTARRPFAPFLLFAGVRRFLRCAILPTVPPTFANVFLIACFGWNWSRNTHWEGRDLIWEEAEPIRKGSGGKKRNSEGIILNSQAKKEMLEEYKGSIQRINYQKVNSMKIKASLSELRKWSLSLVFLEGHQKVKLMGKEDLWIRWITNNYRIEQAILH